MDRTLFDWFPDGVINTSFNALDRHVLAGRGEQDALIYDSAVLGSQQRYTYAELRDLVQSSRVSCGPGASERATAS